MGRKKININSLTDKEDIISKIINQANSLNKKIKAFKNKNISDHSKFLHSFITDDLVRWTKSDTISKSKKFYNDKHILWLKKTFSALHKANNDDYFGTPRKYEKGVTKQLDGLMKYTDRYLRNKGYSEQFISKVVTSKNFLSQLIMRFNEGAMTYGSNQLIDEVALNYGEDTGFSNEEMNKFLSNIEYSQNALNRLNQQQEEFEEFLRLKNKR